MKRAFLWVHGGSKVTAAHGKNGSLQSKHRWWITSTILTWTFKDSRTLEVIDLSLDFKEPLFTEQESTQPTPCPFRWP